MRPLGRDHARTLTLICPGLRGAQPMTRLATIDRLVARAWRGEACAGDAASAILDAFGLASPPGQDRPTAALALLGEDGDQSPGADYWLHAEPVHLRPDRDRLLVFAGATIAPSQEESEALIASFNQHFAAAGLWLTAPHPRRWYLRLAQAPRLVTRPLADVVGQPLPLDIPSGADARRWIGLMNEVQMLFFDSPVNQRRERLGQPLINGLWTWGGGRLPDPLPDPGRASARRPDLVIGEDPLTRGVARWAGVPHREHAHWPWGEQGARHTLLVWRHLEAALMAQDLAAWDAALIDLDARLAEWAEQIRQGRLQTLLIDPVSSGRTWRITRWALRRVWRRGGLAACSSAQARAPLW
ncbi:MAG: phosphoglycerate mutase [Sphingobacteriia bacterium]|nr:phosphoglycerate mutase [Sphingobacteriia bacterium]NCC37890.1 phosphoglycerate mutase [Gammaproteobacteria bacterium]